MGSCLYIDWMAQLHFSHKINSDVETAYNFFTDVHNWCEIVEEPFELEYLSGAVNFKVGSEYLFNFESYGITQEMRFSITETKPNLKITYRQKDGFFKYWSHSIEFKTKGANSFIVEDIHYEMPFGIIGTLFDDFWVRGRIKQFISDRVKNYNFIVSK